MSARTVGEELASIHLAMDRMHEGYDELSELLDDLLRAHAYELAEKIRAEVAPLAVFRSEETRVLVKYGRRLADLIDPDVEDDL